MRKIEFCGVFRSIDNPLTFFVDGDQIVGPTTCRVKVVDKFGDVVGVKVQSTEEQMDKIRKAIK